MSTDARVAVFTDFDDTLTTQNVAQFLLRRFAPEALEANSARYRTGEITFREYQERCFDAVSAPLSEMQAAAEEVEMRDGYLELSETVAEIGGTLTVPSAGLRFYIEPVLEKHGLGHLNVICGTATRADDSGLPGSRPFRYDYPFNGAADEPCLGDWATCKCRALEQAGDGVTTIFVGDGSTSDACVAPRADYVFARDRLLDICVENGVDVTPFDDLRTVAAFVREFAKRQGVVPSERSEQK